MVTPCGSGQERWATPCGEFLVLTDWPAGAFVGTHGSDRPGLLPGIPMRNADTLRLGRLIPRRDPLSARLLIAGLLALLLFATAPAVAHAEGRADATEGWEAFPREPSPTPGKTVAAAPRERVSAVAPDEGPDAFAIVSLLLWRQG